MLQLGFDQFMYGFYFLKLLFILKKKDNKKNMENTIDSIFCKTLRTIKVFQNKNQKGFCCFLKTVIVL